MRDVLWIAGLTLVLGSLPGTAEAQHAHHGGEERAKVAILVYDHVQIIDFTVPYEVFGRRFDVYTVAPEKRPIRTIFGLTVTPDYAFGEHPEPDVVVLPGGGVHNPSLEGAWGHILPVPDEERIYDWVRSNVEAADHVLTVCNGSLILARAGLLDGREATATYMLTDMFQEVAPEVDVRNDRRWVESGKFVMSAGTSSGLDAALHVVERVHGRGAAQALALGLEYDWDPEGEWSRGDLADVHMSFRLTGIDGRSLYREGDEHEWENAWELASDARPEEVLATVDSVLASSRPFLSDVQWSKVREESGDGWIGSRWEFTDAEGRPWAGTAQVIRAGSNGRPVLEIAVSAESRPEGG